MGTIIPQPAGASPFDAIREVDVDGREYWSARRLQPLMGYSRWENLAPAINRAMAAAKNQGANVDANFLGSQEVSGRGPAGRDFRLTRFAAYLVAMNGDPNKREVAAAQGYFAAKTREAEVAPNRMPDITTPAGVLAMAEQFARTARQLVEADKKIAELEPKAVAHDAFLSAQSGDRLLREVAKLLGWRQQDLRRFLVEEKLIFARQAPCGVTVWDFYAANARHFTAVEHPIEHTWGRCTHYTLYVRPAGVDLIQKRVQRWKQQAIASLKT